MDTRDSKVNDEYKYTGGYQVELSGCCENVDDSYDDCYEYSYEEECYQDSENDSCNEDLDNDYCDENSYNNESEVDEFECNCTNHKKVCENQRKSYEEGKKVGYENGLKEGMKSGYIYGFRKGYICALKAFRCRR